MSKMMGQIDLMPFEAMFPNKFPTVGLFQPKNCCKGYFLWKKGNFLCGVVVSLFREAFRVL